MFRLLSTIAGLLFVSTGIAAEFGFGASFKSDETAIYFPVHIGSRVIVEPYFSFVDDESLAFSAKVSLEDTEIGVGLFGRVNPTEKASAYLGVRAAYIRSEQTVEQEISLVTPGGRTSQVVATQTENDGYSIAPTLGFEYFIIDRLTIGAEVAWEYRDLDASVNTSSPFLPGHDKTETSSNRTRTNIILRFYF